MKKMVSLKDINSTGSVTSKIKRELALGFTLKIIAEKLGVKYHAVCRLRRNLKISNEKILENRYKAWASLGKKGVPVTQIADMYGVSEETVILMLRRKLDVKLKSSKKVADSVLEQKTKLKVMSGFELGFNCKMVAEKLGLSYNEVFKCRKLLNLTNEQILENRYKAWASLINKGVSIHAISEKYHVTEETIRQSLWKKLGFSFVESKKINQERLDRMLLNASENNPFKFD